jgi:hypothetical protein|tara:strand:- start:1 stop:447 length:447 start_codon:yes stop_codon:yes gene_type:complete
MNQEVDQPLTLRQEKFIRFYLETGNGAEAARQAGYSPHTARVIAYENLLKPYIKKAIATKRTELMQDSDEKIAHYLSMLEQESSGADQSSSRIRALELLLKAHGAFVERVETVSFDGAFLADLEEIDLDDDAESGQTLAIVKEIKDLH